MLLSTQDGEWDGLAFNYLAAYIEQNAGIPRIQIQDGKNIDQSHINVDLTKTTENRAVAGCNGASDAYGAGNCYIGSGSTYYNYKMWNANSVYFQSTPGPYYMNDWHFVEVSMSLNSIQNGKASRRPDRVLVRRDAHPAREECHVQDREYPNMQWTQFDIAPYIVSARRSTSISGSTTSR